ncbi:MAG: 50S ribosomal protein L21 [Clostridia bacterium]|nr:50S ribosomal protein L21 [Clostridia bacterium]
MFAVVESGGKQYKVEKNDVITVEKVAAEVGAKIDLKVLMISDGKEVTAAAGSVTAEVLRQGKAKKVIVYKYKAKKNERRRHGHRQPYTMLKITSVEA